MITNLPTEILLKIFKYLEGKDIISCCDVCMRLESVVKCLSDSFWIEKCSKEFSDIYEESYRKTDLTWWELYKSLSSWTDISHSDTKVTCLDVKDKIAEFTLLKNQMLSYRKESDKYNINSLECLVNYDLKSFNEICRFNFVVEGCIRYAEDDNVIVFECFNSDAVKVLRIIPKHNRNKYKELICGKMLSRWLLKYGKIFYQILYGLTASFNCLDIIGGDDIQYESSILLDNVDGDIEDVIYKSGNELYILKTDPNDSEDCFISIASVKNGTEHIVYKVTDDAQDNLKIIKSYGFDWTIWKIFSWLVDVDVDEETYDKLSLAASKSYGNYLITRKLHNPFTIYIYHNPFSKCGKFEIDNSQPVKTVDLEMYKEGNSVIEQIDIIETVEGPKLIVLFGSKIFIIKLSHRNMRLRKHSTELST